ncbi:unnamed protein product [Lactuca saligna]|uniref:Uncharacterized protein n=1 Tax=Lactuca saligna TaxID=75948 RepID=A0AA35Z2E7_LACSI|nr:unnamed protein product [Lactuca saligna]
MFQVQILTPTNYPVWGIKVKLIMDAHDICDMVESRAFFGRISRNMIDQQRYGFQDKKGIDKQHCVDIMAVEIQIGWLWIWLGRDRESGKNTRWSGVRVRSRITVVVALVKQVAGTRYNKIVCGLVMMIAGGSRYSNVEHGVA